MRRAQAQCKAGRRHRGTALCKRGRKDECSHRGLRKKALGLDKRHEGEEGAESLLTGCAHSHRWTGAQG